MYILAVTYPPNANTAASQCYQCYNTMLTTYNTAHALDILCG